MQRAIVKFSVPIDRALKDKLSAYQVKVIYVFELLENTAVVEGIIESLRFVSEVINIEKDSKISNQI